MTRILAALGLVLATALPSSAFGAAEPGVGAAAKAFQALSAFKAKSPVRKLSVVNGSGPAVKAGTRQRYVTLRGFANVWGSAYVPQGQAGGVFITVSGDTQLQDNTGRYLSGSVTVSDSSFYHVSGNYVNGWPRPSATVTLYNRGRYVGTVRIEGSIPVSGWNNGGWVRVSGSGWVEGSGYIYEDEEPQAP